MKKILILVLSTFLTLSSFEITSANEVSKKNTTPDELSIKSTVETFIKEDFRQTGGNNKFNYIVSDQFKEYLKARNDLKNFHAKIQNFEPFNENFTFDYDSISENKNKAIVNVNVTEEFSYYFAKERIDGASATDLYIIYLTKVNDSWKIDSATIKADTDLIDDVFDVNKELYSDNLNPSKVTNQNLNKMLSYINDLKDKLKNNIKKDPNNSANNDVSVANSADDVDNSKISGIHKRSISSGITDRQRNLIYNYAYKYRLSNRNRLYLNFSANCANYASQALHEAGGRMGGSHVMDGKKRTWSIKPDSAHLEATYGDAWAQAHYLRGFIVRNEGGLGPGGHAIQYGSTLKKGDLTFIYSNNSKRWFHTYIVVKPGPNFKIACHTKDRWMFPINVAAPESRYPRSYVHLTSLN